MLAFLVDNTVYMTICNDAYKNVSFYRYRACVYTVTKRNRNNLIHGGSEIMNEIYRFPLKQHIGNKAVPCVVKGDEIRRGQPLALQGEGLGSNIFSSVSGTVVKVDDTEIEVRKEREDDGYVPLSSVNPLDLIKESGLVGLGGAGFPTYAKLAKPFDNGGTVIVNAAECEPILSHNIARIENRPEQLIRGLEIAMDVVKADKGVIAIKECHEKAVDILARYVQETNKNITLHALPDIYPMGEERAVVREVMGELLPVGALPLEAGAVIINAETTCRIQEIVDMRKPFIDKDMTVGGKIRGNESEKMIQVFLDVPIGTSVAEMFRKAGGEENDGISEDVGELIMGGPFTGKRTTLDSVVIKTTGGLIASECFPKGPARIGLLVCACGADEERMRQIAESMGSEVAGVQYCKQAMETGNTRKCLNPGKCPGQVQNVMLLKKAGADALLIGNCTDCSNTVMSCAPKLGLAVYHSTDGPLRAVNHKLIRRIKD